MFPLPEGELALWVPVADEDSEFEDGGKPLQQGPLWGGAYCLAGVGAGIAAYELRGWPSVGLWVVGSLLFLAGLWTAAFTGFWLFFIREVQRRSHEEDSDGSL